MHGFSTNPMISLRKIEPTDLPFLYQQDLREYISSTTGDIYKDGQLRLVIQSVSEAVCTLSAQRSVSPQDGLTIGCVDLFDFDPRNRRAALGMYIASEHRGKGVGHEALAKIEEYAFDFLHLRCLYAVIAQTNTACSAIFEHAGYIPSSPLKNWTLESDAVIWIKTR